jgi:CRP/FNR family cyclic AMP-dependent transcriptional regulator
MIQQTHELDQFRKRLHESFQLGSLSFATIRLARHSNVYVCGDPAETVYFLESGQVKLVMPSPHGKECLLALHTAGDLFGEVCLEGTRRRQETAKAMEDTTLKSIPRANLFPHLSRHSLLEGFVQYLAARVAEQQRVMGGLLMVDSEHRLGETLLALARKLGRPDPRNTRIEQKITHEELSEMVGTTRPRITRFMLAFRALGLIEITPEHFLIIKEQKLADYLAGVA